MNLFKNTRQFTTSATALAVILIAFIIFLSSFATHALQPPTKEQLAQYKKQGSLQEKVSRAKTYGNFKASSRLTHGAEQYLTHQLTAKSQLNGNAVPVSITPRNTGFASTGNQKTFTLLLAFSDSLEPEHQSQEVIYNHIYGEGLSERFPRESLTNFYKRSSYDQLTITGEVLPWYTTSYPRDEVTSERDVIKEALRFHEEQGVDFSQYDNDGDGIIDYFSVVWTGEVGEWASQWWGHQTSMSDPSFVLSGKTLSTYSWQALSYDNAVDDFNPRTLIHETGHALGLPDYYDYDNEIGPDLEFPIDDMMRNNSGDHNAFSKFLLGWIEPQVVGSGSQKINLQASSNSQDAMIIMPELTLAKGLSEYFVVQHRDQQDNDKNMYDTGLLIWHVDASLEYSGFKFDNSYSEHPLIKLVYDTNYTEISELYFQPDEELTSLTTPSSASYVESNASVEIKAIEKTDNLISMTASIVNIPKISLSGLAYLEALADNNVLIANVDSVDEITKVVLYVNDELISEDLEAPYQFNVSSSAFTQGETAIVAEAFTATAKGSTTLTVVKLPDEKSLMVVNLTNDDTLALTLDNFLKPVIRMSDVAIVPPSDVPAIFVISHDYKLLTDEQFNRLVDYVNKGGHLYYENTSWYFNRTINNNQWQALGIEATSRFSQTAATISGIDGSVVADLSYSTPESYFLFNELAATATNIQGINNLWQTSDGDFSHAVTNTMNQSKIIATTGEYSWLPSSLTMPVMGKYLDLFGLDSTMKPIAIAIEVKGDENYVEGEHEVEFVITRSYDNGSDNMVTISIDTDNAIEGVDYQALALDNIVFAAGELSKTIELTLLDDLKVDGDKALYVTLSGDDLSSDINDTRAYVYIADNEFRGALQFKESTMSIAENGETFSVTVQRIGGVDEQIEFTISSTNGTAIADTDYQSINETQVFEQFDVEKTFVFSVIDNDSYAVDKDFSLEISSDYLTGVQSSMAITINNDEAAPIPVKPVPTAEKSSSGGASYLLLYLLLLISGYRYRAAKAK